MHVFEARAKNLPLTSMGIVRLIACSQQIGHHMSDRAIGDPYKALPRKHILPLHATSRKIAPYSCHYLKHSRERMFFSPRGQDERQYKQPGQQHARDKRKRRMQRACLKMAASFCPPVHRGPHGSLLPADSIIYPKGARSRLPILLKIPSKQKPNRAFWPYAHAKSATQSS